MAAEGSSEVLLVFCRHGETEANKLGIIQGSGCDFPLTTQGMEDALITGAALKATGLETCWDGVFSSPLKRAVTTTRTMLASSGAASYIEIEEIETLRERGAGVLEGQCFSVSMEEAKRLTAEEGIDNSGFESVADVCQRHIEFLNFVKARKFQHGSKLLCVSHGAFISLFLKHRCSAGETRSVDNCSFTCVRFLMSPDMHKCIPEVLNDTDHLYPPDSTDENALVHFDRDDAGHDGSCKEQTALDFIKSYQPLRTKDEL